jgi:glyoxylase-like metal-dependent hydrolase (beta-lactamase superfamily II)
MSEHLSPSSALVETRNVGSLRIHALDAGLQRLDGGAMFGVVPKPLWERRIPADDRNRIPLALRCLLIEAPDALVLVDTGIGNKEDERFRSIFGVENEGDPTRLEDAIRAAGFTPDDIDLVVLTHLHFDHVGGATRLMPDGTLAPAFPRARHIVQRGEFEFAALPNERVRASYLARNLETLTEAGCWSFVEGESDVTRGVRVIPTPGHTPHHQSVLIQSDGDAAFYLADLCPTAAHLPLPWIMGYDLEPLVTLETKRTLWQQAVNEEWLLIFEHDPVRAWGALAAADGTLRSD